MEKVTLDPAIKFGAGRYRQEKNLLEECGKEISRFGKRAFIIAGNRAWDAVKERMIPGFEKAGLEYELHLYGGKCSYEAAREYAEKCKELGIPFECYNVGCMMPYMNYTPQTLETIRKGEYK